MVAIRQQLIKNTSMKSGNNNGKRFLTIHETDNTDKGANAAAHANLQSRLWEWATWHWTVDAKEAVQSYTHDFQLWHAGDGRGNGNMNSIAIEICVNSDMDRATARRNAAQLAAKILRDEGIPLANMVQHNYWSGKNCPSFIRNEGRWSEFVAMVRQYMGNGSNTTPSAPVPAPSTTKGKTVSQLADEVIAGKYGNGDQRKAALGSLYNSVQAEVNRKLTGGTGGGNPGNTALSIDALAKATLNGEYGNGDERRRRLGNNYAAVQKRVNEMLGVSPAKAPAASSGLNVDAMARKAINGDYGNGDARRKALGGNYADVQKRVNEILSGR